MRARIDELQALAQAIGDPELDLYIQFPTGSLLLAEGDYQGAFLVFEELRQNVLQAEWWTFAGFCYYMSASALLLLKEYDRANDYLKSAHDLFQQTNDLYGFMDTSIKMGYVALEKRDIIQAGEYFQDGLQRARTIGLRRRLLNCILGFAGIALRAGKLSRSAYLFGAAEAMVKVTGSRHDPPDEGVIIAGYLAELRAALDPNQFATAWQEGMQMSFEEVIAYALEGVQGEG
jgi:tetratricopeptide (TPR) repeat protein